MKNLKPQAVNLFSRELPSSYWPHIQWARLAAGTGWLGWRRTSCDGQQQILEGAFICRDALGWKKQKSHFTLALTWQVLGVLPRKPAVRWPTLAEPLTPSHCFPVSWFHDMTAAGPVLSSCCQDFRGTESSCLFLQLLLKSEDTFLRNLQQTCPQVLLSESATYPSCSPTCKWMGTLTPPSPGQRW